MRRQGWCPKKGVLADGLKYNYWRVQSMKYDRFTVELALYVLAVAVAFGLRLLNLGEAPLSDFEAELALAARRVALGDNTALGTRPGYVLLTSVLFFLFGSTNFIARFWPAVVGASLVGLPYFYRHQLGRIAAVLCTFALALDPGSIALSRLAGSPLLAVGLGLWAATAWIDNKPVIAGVCAGLCLLSGPAAIPGIILGAALWAAYLSFGDSIGLAPDDLSQADAPSVERANAVRAGVIAAGGTLILAGTLFLRFPQGLGALASAFPAYLEGWTTPSGVPSLRMLFAAIAYNPLAFCFGLIAGVRAWLKRDPIGRMLSLAWLTALLLALAYPGRVIGDLGWSMIPLLALMGQELARYFKWDPLDWYAGVSQALLVVVFLSFIWLNLAGITRLTPGTPERTARLGLNAGAIGLGAIATVMIALGWSREIAWRGLSWGVLTGLGLYMLATGWGVVSDRNGRAQELWYPQPATVQEDLLLETVGDLSEWNTGRRDGIELVLVSDAPSLQWSLRRLPGARVADRLSIDQLPPLVVTRDRGEPQLAASYRGTDFLWSEELLWTGSLPEDLLRWLIFRDSLTQSDFITLWARADLFLDGSINQNSGMDPGSGT